MIRTLCQLAASTLGDLTDIAHTLLTPNRDTEVPSTVLFRGCLDVGLGQDAVKVTAIRAPAVAHPPDGAAPFIYNVDEIEVEVSALINGDREPISVHPFFYPQFRRDLLDLLDTAAMHAGCTPEMIASAASCTE
jgi:hypothetical protein